MFTVEEHLETVLSKQAIDFIDRRFILPCAPVTLKILVVVDGSISFSISGFGLGLMIDTLRDPVYDYVRFDVTLATRDGAASEDVDPDPYQARYTGFRFDRTEPNGTPTLNRYHQVWCFGFAPGNSGNPSDVPITQPGANPTSDNELAVLTRWMNERQGGVLAMGDHHFLGASMCHRIPRVGTMRRWTNAQGVPPIGGTQRHDTNRPATPGQGNIGGSPDVIPFNNQGDQVPQPIEVKRYSRYSPFVFAKKYRPHPILCDPKYGVIDILPDHPHEGWVIEDAEVQTEGTYDFNGYDGSDYPSHLGIRPLPEVIAWANTLPDPPYNFAKGDTPAKRFGVIGVYDGQKAHVGRVVVDSTWHHWFSENLVGMKADATTNHYERIQTYFRNIGIWLATAKQRARMLTSASWNSIFTARAMQELSLNVPVWVVGQLAIDILGRTASKCLITEWALEILRPDFFFELDRRFKDDPLCLTCPPFDILEQSVIGGLIQELLPLRDEMLELAATGKSVALNEEEIAVRVNRGIDKGLKDFSTTYEATLKHGLTVMPMLQKVKRLEVDAKRFSDREVLQ